ncbi:hypothetical protein PMAYCL1PPCAC_10192, partial [Pristionchus mayeri]
EFYSNADLRIMAEHLYRVATSNDAEDMRNAGAPRGNKIWEDLEEREKRKTRGQKKCNHSSSSMTSKYRKSFHNKLHNVDGLSGKKVLFLYHKYETELGSIARQIIACKYPGYDVTYREGGTIDSYKRNARTDVDSDTEDDQEVDIDSDEESTGAEVGQRASEKNGRVKQEHNVRGAKAKKEEVSDPAADREASAAARQRQPPTTAAAKPEPTSPASAATVVEGPKHQPGVGEKEAAPEARKRKFDDADAAAAVQNRQPPTAAAAIVVKPEPVSPASTAVATAVERPKILPGVKEMEAEPEARKRKLVDADVARKAVKTEAKTPAAREREEQRQRARGAADTDSNAEAAGGWLESDAAAAPAATAAEESGEQLKARLRGLFVQQEGGPSETEVARELLRIIEVPVTPRNIRIVAKAKAMAAGNFEAENDAPVQGPDDDDSGENTNNVHESGAQSTAANVLAVLETLNANGELINAMTRVVSRVKAMGEEEYE